MFDSPEAPIEGEVDKWGFTIKPAISDTDLIIMCLKNAPCGADRKQVDRLVKHYENGEDSILKLYQHPWYEQNGKS
jgi:hypothetical protein